MISGQETASRPVEACSTVRIAAGVTTTGAADRPPAARTCCCEAVEPVAEREPDPVETGVVLLAVTHGAALVSCAGPDTGTVVSADEPPHPPRPAVCRASSDMRSSSCSRPALTCRIRATAPALRGEPCRPARSESSRWERPSSEPMHPW